MKKLCFTGIILMIFTLPTLAGTQEVSKEDKAAIEQAAFDYVDGFYAGSVERLTKALHPNLRKVIVRKLNKEREILDLDGAAHNLIEYVKTGMTRRVEEMRNVKVTLLDVYKDIASVKIDSAMFIDYAHVARINGEWKIINVLWTMNFGTKTEPTEEEKLAIREACLGYVDGVLSGSGERVAKAIHPNLQKVSLRKLPNGSDVLHFTTCEALVEMAKAGMANLPQDQRNISDVTFDIYHNIATVKIDSARFLDYAHIAKINGEWRVINVLWAPH